MSRRKHLLPLLFSFSAVLFMAALLPVTLAQDPPPSWKTICIDPGHGGTDPGAVFDDGTLRLQEKDINLEVSPALQTLLEAQGATHRPQNLINGLDMEQSGSSNLGAPVINAISVATYLTNTRTELFAAALAGDSNLKVNSVAGFVPGQKIIIGTAANAETRTIAAVGTAGTATTLAGASAILLSGSNAGATTILASGAGGFNVGQTVRIGRGTEVEKNIIIGIQSTSLGASIDLAAPLGFAHSPREPIVSVIQAGATNIKVNSVSNLGVGDTLVIDVPPIQETAVLIAVGTAGANGSGVDIAPALGLTHATGALVKDQTRPGTGIDLTAPLDLAHTNDTAVTAILPAGATNIKVASTSGIQVGQVLTIDTGANQETTTVTTVGSSGANGSGLDLAAPLAFAHADGAPVTTGVPTTKIFLPTLLTPL